MEWRQNEFLESGRQTGHAIWSASQLLIDYIHSHSADLVKDRAVLEIGCGLGVCGSAAAALGASHVTLTDGDPDILAKVRHCAIANKLWLSTDTEVNESTSVDCHTRMLIDELRWGEAASEQHARKLVAAQPLDLFLASEVLYGFPDTADELCEQDAVPAELAARFQHSQTSSSSSSSKSLSSLSSSSDCSIFTHPESASTSPTAETSEPTSDSLDVRIVRLFRLADCLMGPTTVFLLAFENRGEVSLEDIYRTADAFGFSCKIPDEPQDECCQDIFTNRTHELTDLWKQCLLRLERLPVPEIVAPPVA
jgi:hypothetical protein